MWRTTVSRLLSLAMALVVSAVAVSGCNRQDQRPAVPTAPTTSLSTPTLSQNYSWQVSLTGGVDGRCEFDWTWQFADGSTSAGGSTDCLTTTSGTAGIPPGATGVIVDGVLVDTGIDCNNDSKSATKSFDGSGNLSITMNLSAGGSFRVPVFFGNTRHMKCPSANATFTLQTL